MQFLKDLKTKATNFLKRYTPKQWGNLAAHFAYAVLVGLIEALLISWGLFFAAVLWAAIQPNLWKELGEMIAIWKLEEGFKNNLKNGLKAFGAIFKTEWRRLQSLWPGLAGGTLVWVILKALGGL